MYWKVYHVDTGKIVKAGFTDEDEAKDWLEAREEDFQDVYMVEEMDQDEEDEWLEAQDKGNYDEEEEEEELEPKDSIGFGEDYYDGADLTEDELSTVIEDDDI